MLWFLFWLNLALAVGGFITDVIIPAIEKKHKDR